MGGFCPEDFYAGAFVPFMYMSKLFHNLRYNTAATLPCRVLWHFLATQTDMAKYLVKEEYTAVRFF